MELIDRRPGVTHSIRGEQLERGPLRPRVLVAIYAPRWRSRGGETLIEACGFNDPLALTEQYVADLADVSGGYLRYRVVETVWLDEFPRKLDGFRYDERTYLRCWDRGAGWHQPDEVDYHPILRRLRAVQRVERGELDEVWLWAPPYSGIWESTMVGRDAYFCNSDPVDMPSCSRRFVVMGFSYERGVGEMLENFGHRVESLLSRLFGGWQQWGDERGHAWDRFTAYDLVAPGRSGCGNVHFAPNSERDYDWGNPRPVLSDCDGWPSYPDGPRSRRLVDSRAWGGGDIRAHHRWWLAHLPRRAGLTDGIRNNWWSYVVDPLGDLRCPS